MIVFESDMVLLPNAGGTMALSSLLPKRIGTVVTIAAFAIAVAGAVMWRVQQPDDVAARFASEDEAANYCLDQNDRMNSPRKANQVEVLRIHKSGSWLRLYRSAPDNWLTVCFGTSGNLDGNFGTTTQQQDQASQLNFYGGYDAVAKAGLLLGQMPTNGTLVQARLAAGQVLQGDHKDSIFVIWEPETSIDGAQVTIYAEDKTVIATATAPTQHD